jgi:hypothetical protein
MQWFSIAEMHPWAPLLSLGFSLGANVLTRYVAEEGESCRLISACALSYVCTHHFHFVLLITHAFNPRMVCSSPNHAFPRTHASICNLLTYICLARTCSLRPGFPVMYSKGLSPNLNLPSRHSDSVHKFPDTRFVQAFSAVVAHSRLTAIQCDTLIRRTYIL